MLGQTKRVLVVDDEEALADAIATVIKAWGRISVTRANSVPSAVGVLEDTKVDLIISDINMNAQSGYDLINFVQEKFPDIPVILISGKVNIYDDYECSSETFKKIYAFFEKPFDFGDLKKTVHEALEQTSKKKVS